MLQIILENEYGQRLDLLNDKNYDLIHADGLTPASATINTSKMANKDGTKYNSSTLNERYIILTVRPKGNIEENRLNLYKFVRPKKYIKLYLKNGSRDVWIDGYCEDCPGDLFEMIQTFQFSIVCPDPYFKSNDTVEETFSSLTPRFTFPFAITSDGTIISELVHYEEVNISNPGVEECGIVVEIYAFARSLEPTIHNITTGESFTIEHDFMPGDVVRLNTRNGEKSLTLIRDGIEVNILNQMSRNSQWLKLALGDNMFMYSAIENADFMQITVKVQPLLTGV